MSSQSLILTGTYPFTQIGSFNTTATAQGTVTFNVPFPQGAIPIVILTNASGNVWSEILISTQQANNTTFTWTQTPPAGGGNEVFSVNFIAIWKGHS